MMSGTEQRMALAATAKDAVTGVDVLWITAGCDGDTIAMTAAAPPSIEAVILGQIPWIPRVTLHNPFLALTISIPGIEGEIALNPYAIELSSLHMIVQASSLTVTDDISAKDREEINRRIHGEVLDSDSFPEIEYQSSNLSASKTAEGQYWAAITGELMIHGIKRTQPISARLSSNGTTLRAAGEFAIRQSDYEIRPVTALGGAVKLKDELKLSFDITARKQAGANREI